MKTRFASTISLLILLFCTLILTPTSSLAQCNCTVTVPTNIDNVDGANYQGSPICVTGSATARHHLRFININGSSAQPITIINGNGNVILNNNNSGYAFNLLRSRYVHVTGTGPGMQKTFKLLKTGN